MFKTDIFHTKKAKTVGMCGFVHTLSCNILTLTIHFIYYESYRFIPIINLH